MANKKQEIFGRKSLLIVTGASKGLGRSLSFEFSKKLGKDSHILLLSRSKESLNEVKTDILKFTEPLKKEIGVHCFSYGNLEEADENTYRGIFKSFFISTNLSQNDFEQTIIIHNAASLGDVSKEANEFNSFDYLQEYFKVNVTSAAVLNSVFLEYFPPSATIGTLIIQISSICALQPFKTWSLYCTGKAARDMFFRVLAVEQPYIRVLNYAPGPLDTDMQIAARTETKAQDMKEVFVDLHKNGSLLSTTQSTLRLVKITEANIFESGDHIDYFDIKDNGEEPLSNS